MAASDAMGAGDYAKAVELYTTALGLMPSPLTFAKRAECYLKLSKPNAAAASTGRGGCPCSCPRSRSHRRRGFCAQSATATRR